jgi:protein-tyrosine-phosphatase
MAQIISLTPLPSRVIFACTHNSIRSPMAAAIGNHLLGQQVQFSSVGVRAQEVNPFAVACMAELGLDISGHVPRNFPDLPDNPCDLIISLTPEAQHHGVELTRSGQCEAIYWPTQDPSLAHGNRTMILDAFREVREMLQQNIEQLFPRSIAQSY